MIAARVISVLIGYVLGLFQTGYIYGRAHGIDIRTQGSGNSGTTNSLRVLGIKAGIVTFLGDLFKAILAVVVIYFLFRAKYPEMIRVLELYAGFGAVLGHNFPFYMNFKGGKGIACTSGVILAVCPLAAPICLLAFILCLVLTRYVSLGSICVVILYLIQAVLLNHFQVLGIDAGYILEFDIVSACFTAMALWRHRENIRRLLHGNENKFSLKKKEKQTS
jgi:glycerol-3-phosphate acyltransferase PlsY